MTTNMTFKNFAAKNETLANAVKALDKVEKFTATREGAYGVICKYWDVRGACTTTGETATTVSYHEVANALGVQKPKDFRALVFDLLDGKGLHPNMFATIKDKEGNDVSVPGLWSTKAVEKKDKALAVKDAKGKETYPNIFTKDKDGKSVKVKCDCIKPIGNRITPAMLWTLLIQQRACEAGFEPYTENMFFNEHEITKVDDEWIATSLVPESEAAPVDAPVSAPVETPAPVAEAPTAPTPAKGGKRGKKNAA